MFPFYGMPQWAQWLGNILPLTHFIKITRGILLKGNDFSHVMPSLWPILAFMVVALFIGVKRYRQTLDSGRLYDTNRLAFSGLPNLPGMNGSPLQFGLILEPTITSFSLTIIFSF